MGNGLLAEWQRGLVTRGVAAVALLALPVGVAAAVGFSPSASGLSEGLGSLASGPVEPSAGATDDGRLDDAIVSVTTPAGPAAPATGSAGGGTGGGAGGIQGGSVGGGAGTGSPPVTGTPVTTPGGAGVTPGQAGQGVPAVPSTPVTGGGAVEQIVGGLGGALNGLLGGGN